MECLSVQERIMILMMRGCEDLPVIFQLDNNPCFFMRHESMYSDTHYGFDLWSLVVCHLGLGKCHLYSAVFQLHNIPRFIPGKIST
ncbi:hypothetical protein J6590_062534 [Homalodisca vitripennis]|nr:hypothetical protein J6590_062534 [Homalodisca vitripennis]